jgi:cytochrome c-type biogenesis protein CcmE
VLVAVGGWFAFSSRSLDRSLVYSYTPGDIAAGRTPSGDIRVGGQVAPGSVRWNPQRRLLRFVLRDDRGSVSVLERGAPPALFAAGRGAIVEGRLENGVLVSSSVIVRHGSDYRPPSPGAKRR